MVKLAKLSKTQNFLIARLKHLSVLFPGLLAVLELSLIYRFAKNPSPALFALVLLCPYLVPLALFRLHQAILPQKEGRSFFGIDYYNPWLTGFRLQLVFVSFPFLERVLLLFPGLFSFWLRLWGSHVGKGVMWTPHIEICDRANLSIGDHVMFGNKCYLSPHVVDRLEEKKFFLYLKNIRIEDGAFIGAGTRLGPGVVVEKDVQVPLLTDVGLNVRVNRESIEGAVVSGLSRKIEAQKPPKAEEVS